MCPGRTPSVPLVGAAAGCSHPYMRHVPPASVPRPMSPLPPWGRKKCKAKCIHFFFVVVFNAHKGRALRSPAPCCSRCPGWGVPWRTSLLAARPWGNEQHQEQGARLSPILPAPARPQLLISEDRNKPSKAFHTEHTRADVRSKGLLLERFGVVPYQESLNSWGHEGAAGRIQANAGPATAPLGEKPRTHHELELM